MTKRNAVEFRIPKMDALRRRIKTDVLLLKPVMRLVTKVALVQEREARIGAKPHGGDTGGTARSIESVLPTITAPWVAVVGHDRPYVDLGRRAGKMPPVAPIADWLRRHGSSLSPFMVARSIGKKGTKGLKFMKRGTDAAKRELPHLVDATIREVEAIFGRPL